ncbi:glycosyltransferase family 2 protein [Lacticaseibacillus camelliae]|uniref:Glycosyltransferase n=1 Tax=Lacticaseibacillus camelliae DSM 22697 = JCM 13995 TaxID=1423730 RepID=A0A0R2FA09_9LACO|nr:glycosyltransferase family 2 protein [Lacticaseibacillus camelliae]KRN25176.1 glycosyltransferase [Lacticaseibacillus camelliae DSM 22697 = JCM 13995]
MERLLLAVPCYNEADNVEELYQRVVTDIDFAGLGLAHEVLFINDGSTDQTGEIIKALAHKHEDVSYISLSRNYGKETAMVAAFDYFHHDAMIMMDADLQHPPVLVNDMIKLWRLGYEDVYAKRNKREGESWFKIKTSQWFYRLLGAISRTPVTPDAGDFRLLDKKVVVALRALRESQRYTKGLYNVVGFRKVAIDFDAAPRLHGKSKWSLFNLINLASEGVTSYTTAPLRLSTFLGFIVSGFAFLYMIYLFVKTIIVGPTQSGFPTIVILILFLGGCILISNGILGEYLARVFMESKNRPLYFVEEKKTNDEQRDSSR